MENKECKVVQDLLPNYIEKLTSEETNKFIEEHLKTCPECQAMLESMKAEIKIDTVKQDDREVEYIKKFNVKFKKVEYKLFVLIYTILAILIVGTVGFFGRKYIIFQDLAKKAEEIQKISNYHVKSSKFYGLNLDHIDRYVEKREEWFKDNVCYITYIDENEFTTILKDNMFYQYMNNELTYLDSMDDYVIGLHNGLLFDEIELLKSKTSIFTHYLSDAIINGKECYQIRENDLAGSILYIEKETGLVIRSEHRSGFSTNDEYQSTVTDYKYEFDCVTDEELDSKIKQLETACQEQIQKIEPDNSTTETLTKTAKFGEMTKFEDEDIIVEIGNVNYDRESHKIKVDINSRTKDEFFNGPSFDYMVYDTDKNIIATSLIVEVDSRKKQDILSFTQKHYNNADFAEIMKHMIGSEVCLGGEGVNNGNIRRREFIESYLIKEPNLDSLTVELTNISYYDCDQDKSININKDFIVTFN